MFQKRMRTIAHGLQEFATGRYTQDESLQRLYELRNQALGFSTSEDAAVDAFTRSKQYQEWENGLAAHGCTVKSVEVVPLVTLPNGTPFMAAIKPDVYVVSEGRHKTNETVVMRPSLTAVVVYSLGNVYGEDRFLLIREFRSSVGNRDGMVWEMPGGSSTDASLTRVQVAMGELWEEAGLKIELRESEHFVGSFQTAPTVLTHHVDMYAVEITGKQMDVLSASSGKRHGNPGETEITYPYVASRREIIHDHGARFGTDVLRMISLVNLGAVGMAAKTM